MNQPAPRKKKVFWTDDEAQLIAAYMLRQSIRPDDRGFIVAVRDAQTFLLPAERRKEVASRQSISAVEKWMKIFSDTEAADRKLAAAQVQAQTLRVPEPELKPTETISEEDKWKLLDAATSAPAAPAPSLGLEASLIGVLQSLGESLAQVFIASFRAEIERQLPAIETWVADLTQSFPPPLAKPTPSSLLHRKPHIFVLGLLPMQEHEIRKAFGQKLIFRFLKDTSPEKIKSAVDWADQSFVMTKFISHSDYYLVKDRGDVTHVNGAVSSLIVAIGEYAKTSLTTPKE